MNYSDFEIEKTTTDRLASFTVLQEEAKRNFNLLSDKLFTVEQLPQGQINSYQKESGSQAVFIAEDGTTPTCVHPSDTHIVPAEFLVTADVTIGISEIAQRSPKLHEKLTQKLTSTFYKKDEKMVLALFEKCLSLTKNTYKINRILSFFSKKHKIVQTAKAIAKVYAKHQNVTIVCTQESLASYKEILATHGFETPKECSLFYGVNTAVVDTDNPLFKNAMYILSDPIKRYKAVRVDYTVIPADKFVFGEPNYGWLSLTQESLSIGDVYSISKLKF